MQHKTWFHPGGTLASWVPNQSLPQDQGGSAGSWVCRLCQCLGVAWALSGSGDCWLLSLCGSASGWGVPLVALRLAAPGEVHLAPGPPAWLGDMVIWFPACFWPGVHLASSWSTKAHPVIWFHTRMHRGHSLGHTHLFFFCLFCFFFPAQTTHLAYMSM